jgi:hypothetical protein
LPQPPSEDDQQARAAAEFASNLQRKFSRGGYDIEVTTDRSHSLTLTSDEFKESDLRSSISAELVRDKKTICGMGIWYVYVGYNKGLVSGDVMKGTSVGCRAAKAAEAEATKIRQSVFVDEINAKLSGIKFNFVGDTFVCESEYFDDHQRGYQYARNIVLQMVGLSDKLCGLGAKKIMIKGKIIKTEQISLHCP